MRYLIDSDALIASKNNHYRPEFCEAFWEWIVSAHKAQRLFSIDKVRAELLNGKKTDPLYVWVQQSGLNDFFVESWSSAGMWTELSRWTMQQTQYHNAAKDKFLAVDSADAWLIAVAATKGNFTVVTQETPDPYSRKSVKIPDAAKALGVPTTSLFELLSATSHKTFILK